MITEFFDIISANITLILLIVSVGIFGGLAIQSRKIKSFQFQMSVFIIMWLGSEIIGVLARADILNVSLYESIGHQIHLASMATISVIFWMRFYFSTRKGKKFIDEIPTDLK